MRTHGLILVVALGLLQNACGGTDETQYPILIETGREPLERTDLCAELVITNQAVIRKSDEVHVIPYETGHKNERVVAGPMMLAFGPVEYTLRPFEALELYQFTGSFTIEAGLAYGAETTVQIPLAPESALRPHLDVGYKLRDPQVAECSLAANHQNLYLSKNPVAALSALECGYRIKMEFQDESGEHL